MMNKTISQSQAIARWQKELNSLMESILLGDMSEGKASKHVIKEVNKLVSALKNSIDYEKDIKVAVKSYYDIYQKHVGAGVIDKQVRLAAEMQKKTFNKVLKKLPKQIRETINRDMKVVSNVLASGQITKEVAVKQLMKQQQGITVATPKQGKWKLQNLLNLQLREAMKDTCLTIAEEIAKELNTDVYYVAGHAGARPGCEPRQEKYYSDTYRGPAYVDGHRVMIYLWSDTETGIFPSLFDIRCRHMKFPVSAEVRMKEVYSVGEGSMKNLKDNLEDIAVLS